MGVILMFYFHTMYVDSLRQKNKILASIQKCIAKYWCISIVSVGQKPFISKNCYFSGNEKRLIWKHVYAIYLKRSQMKSLNDRLHSFLLCAALHWR